MSDLRAIHAWVDQLPPEGRWTAEKRGRWLTAIERLVDYAMEVVEPGGGERDA